MTEGKQRDSKGLQFLVRIQYRQNASWQGSLQWLNKKKNVPFRSLLEMLTLIREAGNENQDLENAPHFHSWQDREEDIS